MERKKWSRSLQLTMQPGNSMYLTELRPGMTKPKVLGSSCKVTTTVRKRLSSNPTWRIITPQTPPKNTLM